MNVARQLSPLLGASLLIGLSAPATAADGSVTWTTVSTTHVYSDTEDLDALQGVIDGATAYCSVDVSSASGLTGNGTCGSPTTNLGFHLSTTFPVCADADWDFRLGPDYGRGGALFLDGVEQDGAEDDLWWAGSWANTGELLTGGETLGLGVHTLDAIGFEGCCDGPQELQFRIDSGSWATVTPEDVGCDYCADDDGLGPASPYNVFVLGDFDGDSSDIGGRIAIGGDATFKNYGIGSGVSGGVTLSVAGDLTATSSQIYGGDGEVGGSCTTSSVGTPSGSLVCGVTDVFDASEHAGEMAVISHTLSGLAATGTTTTTSWGGVYLSGSDPDLNVFELDLDALGFASWVWMGYINTFSISAPSGSTVVVNVVGDTDPLFKNGGISTSGVGAGDIVWNFAEGGALTIKNVSVPGSILAPTTDLTFNNGNINGTVVVASMSGRGEFHDVEFDGDICPFKPEPYTVGNDTALPTKGSFGANYLLGTTIVVPDDITVTHFGVVGAGAGDVQMALYTDTGSGPGTLVAKTGLETVASGANEYAISEVSVSAGTYYIMAVYDSLTTNYYTTATSKVVYYKSHTFGTAPPTTWTGSLTFCCQDYSYYLVGY